MRAIDADALKSALWETWGYNSLVAEICEFVDKQPTIQSDEPRVMTLDEVVEHFSLPPVFVDDLDAQEDYYEDIQPLYFEYPYQEKGPWYVHWRGHAQSQRYLDERRHTYNREWRCWTARPTDEQRKAVKWDAAD